MIKFFRKIRQKLLSENKVSNYLLYAAGEIVLVVIGILIALQVNSWYEQQKQLGEERQVITTLHKEFEANLKDLRFDISRIDSQITSLRILHKLFGEEELPREEYIDSLILISFRHLTWNPSSYMLNDLKNSGQISKLSDPKLQLLLFKWERHYENLLELTADDKLASDIFLDYLRKNASLRNVDYTAPIPNKGEWKRSQLGFSNVRLLQELQFENVVDDKLAVVLGLREAYIASVEIMEELLAITEP